MESKPVPSGHLKLDDLVKNKTISFSIASRDPPEEARAKLDLTKEESAHQREKDRFLYRAITVLVCVVSGGGFIVALIPVVPDDTRRWATTLVSSIVSAALGYMTGKGSK